MAGSSRTLPPLNTLATFEAAARLGSFTAAANERHVTQAAVSRQMRLLEADLDARLFVRGRRSVSLTSEGAELLRAVRPALERLVGTAEDIRARRRDRSLTVFSELGLATGWLIPRLLPFLLEHPDIQVRLVTSDEPIEHYPRRCHLGLQTGQRTVDGFETHRLDADQVLAVCAPGHDPALGPDAAPAALLDARLLEMEWAAGQWLDWSEFLEHAGLPGRTPLSTLRFTSYPVMLHAAKLGYGVALAWRHSVARELGEGALVRAVTNVVTIDDGVCAYLREDAGGRERDARTLLEWLAAGVAQR